MSKKIVVSCEKCGSRNYSLPGNGKNNAERLVLKKYCNHCNEHTLHRQTA